MSPLQSGCASHHASWDAAAEPDPGAVLLGNGGHCLPMVPDLHLAPGSFPLHCQPCLQVRLSPLLLLSTLLALSLRFKPIVCTFPARNLRSSKRLTRYKCLSYFKKLVTYSCINRCVWHVSVHLTTADSKDLAQFCFPPSSSSDKFKLIYLICLLFGSVLVICSESKEEWWDWTIQ